MENETVTVKLDGADEALYRSGRQVGIAEEAERVVTALASFESESIEQLGGLVESIRVGGAEARRLAMDEMRRAIELGAGRARRRTLRERVRNAMIGAVTGWKR